MNEGKNFEVPSSESPEENLEDKNEKSDRRAELQDVLVDQAKAIIGNTEVDPEILAKLMMEKNRNGELIGVKFKEDVDLMSREDFVEVAKRAIEEKKTAEEDDVEEKPVLTPRDIPDITMDDPDRL